MLNECDQIMRATAEAWHSLCATAQWHTRAQKHNPNGQLDPEVATAAAIAVV
jgi:hypothetical protein